MKLYNLTEVRNQILTDLKYKGIEEKKDTSKISSIYSTRYAIDKLSLTEIHMIISDDPKFTFYINEEQLSKINLLAKMSTGLPLSFDMLKPIVSDNIFTHKVNKSDDLKEVVLAYKKHDMVAESVREYEEQRTIRKAKTLETNNRYGFVSRSVMSKRIVSLDFEFDPNDKLDVFQFSNISEIGVTVYENGQVTAKHYLVEENKKESNKAFLQDKFLFGNSETITIEDIDQLLKNVVADNDVLLVHSYSTEIKFLDNNNIDISNLEIYDTQLVFKNYFDNDQPNLKRLSHMLQHFDLSYSFLHNAGNDAYHTLNVFHKMIDNIPKQIIKPKMF